METTALAFGVVAAGVLALFAIYSAKQGVKPALTDGMRELDEKLSRQSDLIDWLQKQSLQQAQRIQDLERDNARVRAELDKLVNENHQLRTINDLLTRQVAGGGMRKATAQLREVLTTSLSDADLRALAFDIGVNYEELGGEGKAGKVTELLVYSEQRNLIDKLVARLRETRPDIRGNL